jgi:alcohol dehydrogenase class IV
MDVLAQSLGLPKPGFEGVASWIDELCQELSIPKTLSELGVDDRKADAITEAALVDPTAPTNPVPLERPAVRVLFLAALRGGGLR